MAVISETVGFSQLDKKNKSDLKNIFVHDEFTPLPNLSLEVFTPKKRSFFCTKIFFSLFTVLYKVYIFFASSKASFVFPTRWSDIFCFFSLT